MEEIGKMEEMGRNTEAKGDRGRGRWERKPITFHTFPIFPILPIFPFPSTHLPAPSTEVDSTETVHLDSNLFAPNPGTVWQIVESLRSLLLYPLALA